MSEKFYKKLPGKTELEGRGSTYALVAITSAASYPSKPTSPAVLRLTISDNFAVAVSFKRSTVFRSGIGSPDSAADFDCLATWLADCCGHGRRLRSLLLVYWVPLVSMNLDGFKFRLPTNFKP